MTGERTAAVAVLRRAASLREQQPLVESRPLLQRTASERARDMAMAKLMGAGPAEPSDDPATPSFRTAGPPPTLEELQRRHMENAQLPSAPTSPSPPATAQRQEARTNLIRKLSRGREAGGLRGARPAEPAVEPSTLPVPPPQPFESDIIAPPLALEGSDSSASSGPASTAPTSRGASQDAVHVSFGHRRDGSGSSIRKAPPPALSPTLAPPVSVPVSSAPSTATFSSEDDSPSEVLGGRASTAPSLYRAYRHTMERDRDSAFARLTAEDVWEYDQSSGTDQDSPRVPLSARPPVEPPAPSAAYRFPAAPEPSEREPVELLRQPGASDSPGSAPSYRTAPSHPDTRPHTGDSPPRPPERADVSAGSSYQDEAPVARAPPRERILTKLGSILDAAQARGVDGHALDDPPRRLLLHAPVLQVVNANTVKDRYLFLFSDVLVIAKPVLDDDADGHAVAPTLDTRFLVKSVVETSALRLTATREDDEPESDPVARRKHPQLLAFVDRFANSPHRAVQTLVAKGGIANDPAVIASLLFRTPELNRSQLGAFLAARESRHVLKAYVERFRFHGVRIEDALRAFLASIRLPNDHATAEHLFAVFGAVWLAHNPDVSRDAAFARTLVFSILELNDYVNSAPAGGDDAEERGLGNLFGFPNPAVSVEDFIAAFRMKDAARQADDQTLMRIFLSIRGEQLRQAADNGIARANPEIAVTMTPARLPARLTFRQSTAEIALSIPRPDPHFSIRLVGRDLLCEPAVLSFATSRTQTFRVTGTALGHKTLLFLRHGPHAMRYTGVPVNKSFSVERAFMRHTFQLAFVNHLAVKRKYMFSLADAPTRLDWVRELEAAVARPAPALDRPTSAARGVALQVLRDAVIAPDEVAPAPAPRSKPATPRPGSAGTAATRHVRSNSVSRTYPLGAGRDEAELNGATDSPSARLMRRAATSSPFVGGRRGSAADVLGADKARTGHDLVVLVRQNSLLPSVLGLMHALADS